LPKNSDLRKFVAAPLINQLWLKDLIIVVRIDNNSIFTRYGDEYHPCDENGDFVENNVSSDFKYCNPDGSAFLLVYFPQSYDQPERNLQSCADFK
jgi:hypothetical protein